MFGEQIHPSQYILVSIRLALTSLRLLSEFPVEDWMASYLLSAISLLPAHYGEKS